MLNIGYGCYWENIDAVYDTYATDDSPFWWTQKEKTRLEDMLSERDAKIAELEARLAQASMDYESLKMARMIEVTDGDVEGAQKRISKLIRDVNKCITLLSEK